MRILSALCKGNALLHNTAKVTKKVQVSKPLRQHQKEPTEIRGKVDVAFSECNDHTCSKQHLQHKKYTSLILVYTTPHHGGKEENNHTKCRFNHLFIRQFIRLNFNEDYHIRRYEKQQSFFFV